MTDDPRTHIARTMAEAAGSKAFRESGREWDHLRSVWLGHADAALEALGLACSPDGAHRYLSTGCLHGEHGYCQANTGSNGQKSPAQCKFCAAPCQCGCHQQPDTTKEA